MKKYECAPGCTCLICQLGDLEPRRRLMERTGLVLKNGHGLSTGGIRRPSKGSTS